LRLCVCFSWFKETGGLHSVRRSRVPTSIYIINLPITQWFEPYFFYEKEERIPFWLIYLFIICSSLFWAGRKLESPPPHPQVPIRNLFLHDHVKYKCISFTFILFYMIM
jgi:hypothetical protein